MWVFEIPTFKYEVMTVSAHRHCQMEFDLDHEWVNIMVLSTQFKVFEWKALHC